MKILISVERHDSLEFFLQNMLNLGYKAGIAKERQQIIPMLSDERYDAVLTENGYSDIDLDKYIRSEIPSTYIMHIKDSPIGDEDHDSKTDRYTFGIPELLQAVKSHSNMGYLT